MDQLNGLIGLQASDHRCGAFALFVLKKFSHAQVGNLAVAGKILSAAEFRGIRGHRFERPPHGLVAGLPYRDLFGGKSLLLH